MTFCVVCWNGAMNEEQNNYSSKIQSIPPNTLEEKCIYLEPWSRKVKHPILIILCLVSFSCSPQGRDIGGLTKNKTRESFDSTTKHFKLIINARILDSVQLV